jgi:1-acyl-sn-glycerol-3-phosphate acyltransferase
LSSTVKPTNFITRLFRLARVALHLACAVATTGLVFHFLGHAGRVDYIQRWSARLLAILAIRLEVSGTPPLAGLAPAMIVANHVSWLDIFALNSTRAVRFVAKSEIRRWPVFGWLCAQVGTLFIERTRRHHIAQINGQMAAALRQGDVFAVFPEGMISAGNVLLPFHASLLQPALACDAMLYPVAIRYTRADGSLCSEADYEGDKSMLGSLLLMVTQPVICARLQFLAPLACAGKHRRELAHETARLIAGVLGVSAPRKRIDTVAGPKA